MTALNRLIHRVTPCIVPLAHLMATFLLLSCREQLPADDIPPHRGTPRYTAEGSRSARVSPQAAGGRHEGYVTEVEAMALRQGPFFQELMSNGRLRALRKSRLSFPYSESVRKVYVRSGQAVEEGQLLAELCRRNLERRLADAAMALKQARLDMAYLLLGHGFTLADSLRVPAHIWQMAGISSGYLKAGRQYANLESDLERTRITAPFSGLVAGVEVSVHEQARAGDTFCTLIDNSAFLVSFPVMEFEYDKVSLGSKVAISPFARPDREYTGHVHSIEPLVDDHGQVKVTALISGSGDLVEGTNVRVAVRRKIPDRLVVPKSAVLFRDRQEVLFRYEKGQAVWTYVAIVHENSTHYSVEARADKLSSLQCGDTVIIAGNRNLAHGSAVNIR